MKVQDGFHIDIRPSAPSCLEAQDLLQHLDNEATFHIQNNLRPALGIYNISTSRVLKTVRDVCSRIEVLLHKSNLTASDKPDAEISELERELTDYLELLFYAAADHVDDLELITKYFYADKYAASKSKPYTQFKGELKRHKHFISAITNHIKHSQHRIRLYHIEFSHSNHSGTMYGYIVEGVENGVVGPSPVFHASNHSVFSVASLPWQVLMFLLSCSRSLHAFLAPHVSYVGPSIGNSKDLTDAVIAAARIPFYTMDETDYLATVPFSILMYDAATVQASSGLYGSFTSQWHHASQIQFGRQSASFMGDGITKSFKMLISPSKISLRRVPQT